MAEILHQFIGSFSMFFPLFVRFHTSQVVQDFSHQQYDPFLKTVWTRRSQVDCLR